MLPLPPLPRRRRGGGAASVGAGARPGWVPVCSWGGVGQGRWAEAVPGECGRGAAVVGVCGGCECVKPAVDLKWRPGVFGRDGRWLCGMCE